MLRRLPRSALVGATSASRTAALLNPIPATVGRKTVGSNKAALYHAAAGRRTKRVSAKDGKTLSARSFTSSVARQEETVKVPQMAESISEGTLKQWLKKSGDFVKADEEVATIETDKIDVSVNAPKSGTITETLAEEEDTVSVGQDLFKLEPGDEPSGGSGGGGKKEEKPKEDEGGKDEVKDEGKDEGKEEKKDEGKEEKKEDKKDDAPPPPRKSDRRKKESQELEKREEEPKREEPIPTENIRQPEGRKDYGKEQPKEKEKEDKPKPFERTERRVKMNRMRTRIAERLKQSQNTAASLTTFQEIDMSSLMEMRKLYKDEVLKEKGIKIGFMSAFAKAACLALKEIPAANASIEGEGGGDTILYRDYVDLSVAVATPKGLVTPVVRNAESMGFVEIEQEIAELGKKARDGKLTIEDMAGGSFTISNGGVFGSLYGTPIINLPQSAVLGMHATKETPVVRNGEIVIRPIMIVALTYDHRLLDGREAVTFLVKIKQYIEDPRKMLLA